MSTPAYTIVGAAVAMSEKRFQHPLLIIRSAFVTQNAQTTILFC